MKELYHEEYSADVIKEVCSLLNTSGGTVVFGNEYGYEDDIQELVDMLIADLNEKVSPDPMEFIRFDAYSIDDKDILEVQVDVGNQRPYYLNEIGMANGGVFVYNEDLEPLDKAAVSELLNKKENHFESVRCLKQDLTFEDFNAELSQHNLQFNEDDFHDYGLINDEGLYTNLGYLFSDQCDSSVKFVAMLHGEIVARKEFGGCLLKQFVDINQYLFDMNLKVEQKRSIYESLCNAMIHRDYCRGGSTMVQIINNTMRIISLGGPYEISEEAIRMGACSFRNPKLMRICQKLRLVRNFGTGMNAIYRFGDFKCSEDAFSVELDLSKDKEKENETKEEKKVVKEEVKETKIAEVKEEKPVAKKKTNNVEKEKLSDKERKIMDYINKHEKITRKEAQEILGLGKTVTYQCMQSLLEQGLIESIGKGKGVYYIAA